MASSLHLKMHSHAQPTDSLDNILSQSRFASTAQPIITRRSPSRPSLSRTLIFSIPQPITSLPNHRTEHRALLSVPRSQSQSQPTTNNKRRGSQHTARSITATLGNSEHDRDSSDVTSHAEISDDPSNNILCYSHNRRRRRRSTTPKPSRLCI
jgi:hypothetical protein